MYELLSFTVRKKVLIKPTRGKSTLALTHCIVTYNLNTTYLKNALGEHRLH